MFMLNINTPSPLEKINHPLFKQKKINVYIKRDDLIHPLISGNKWRKLKLNIDKFHHLKCTAILTFGGAYSNHIAATAAIGNLFNIQTIGIIRGDELNINSNDTLFEANENKMKLFFVSREEYDLRYDKIYHQSLREKYGNIYIIEEGGANYLGVMGCTEIINELNEKPDYIYTASGTGTTASGLLFATDTTKIVSIPVFKNGNFMFDEIKKHLFFAGIFEDEVEDYLTRLQIDSRFHFGGYGKYNDELIDFINEFYSITKIKLDQIYTSKMVYSFLQHVKEDKFKEGETIVLLHTGGLQGLNSIKSKLNFQ